MDSPRIIVWLLSCFLLCLLSNSKRALSSKFMPPSSTLSDVLYSLISLSSSLSCLLAFEQKRSFVDPLVFGGTLSCLAFLLNIYSSISSYRRLCSDFSPYFFFVVRFFIDSLKDRLPSLSFFNWISCFIIYGIMFPLIFIPNLGH
jgi:hypothetical protein